MSETRFASWPSHQRLCVRIGPFQLTPTLTLPERPRGLVLVANASGDRTYERGNRALTAALGAASFATLDVDLLTHDEALQDAEASTFRFDMDLIAGRVAAVLAAANRVPALQALETGVLAAGPCAAGVLIAAAERPDLVQSIVCRSARPELAGEALAYVHAPVLLVLGERATAHRDGHYTAMTLLPPRSRLEIVPNARHLLDRPDHRRRVAALAVSWFGDTLSSRCGIAGRWMRPVSELTAS